jgi:hypothetical protein
VLFPECAKAAKVSHSGTTSATKKGPNLQMFENYNQDWMCGMGKAPLWASRL